MKLFDRIFGKRAAVDFEGFIDWHSHILPGVDDGVKTLDDSLAILEEYGKMGIREVWLTPHIMEDMANTPQSLRERFGKLAEAYDGPVRLHLAAENMIDLLFSERLAANDLLPVGPKGDMLLVETSYFNPPMNFENVIGDITRAGYFPLVAHPERYAYVESADVYRHWKELGCRFQLNLLSLAGGYGERARRQAVALLGRGMYDFAGTDIHSPSQLDRLKGIRFSNDIMDHLQSLLSNNQY